MTDAYENENLPQEGQPVDNVGQDEGQATGESSNGNWEEQAKYFQSEKDKLASENKIRSEDINEDIFKSFLYSKNVNDIDLLIRTSGELRISNFMLGVNVSGSTIG